MKQLSRHLTEMKVQNETKFVLSRGGADVDFSSP